MATDQTRLTAFKNFDKEAAKDFEVRFEQKQAAIREGRLKTTNASIARSAKRAVASVMSWLRMLPASMRRTMRNVLFNKSEYESKLGDL